MSKIKLLTADIVVLCTINALHAQQQPLQTIKIVTSVPTRLVVNNADTFSALSKSKVVSVPRQNKMLTIRVWNDTASQSRSLIPRAIRHPLRTMINSYGYQKYVYINMSSNAAGQRPPVRYGVPSKRDITVKWTPLRIISLTNPAIDIAIERRMATRWGTQVALGYLLPKALTKDIIAYRSYTGYSLALEQRYFFKSLARSEFYVATEGRYLYNHYRTMGRFVAAGQYAMPYTDTFKVYKNVWALHGKLGYQIRMGKHLMLDAFAGIGARYISNKHTDRIQSGQNFETPKDPSINVITNLEGKRWDISIPFNLRIGYLF